MLPSASGTGLVGMGVGGAPPAPEAEGRACAPVLAAVLRLVLLEDPLPEGPELPLLSSVALGTLRLSWSR